VAQRQPPTEAEQQLAGFIAKFSDQVASLTQSILVKMRALYPTAIEIVYDNYNALAIGFGPTERPSQAIFSIAVFPRWVSLFFLQANGLPDPDRILRGSGKRARHVRLPSAATFDEFSVKNMMREAAATRISCHGAPPTDACAACIKESRMEFAEAAELHRKFGGER
jgi:hypothetical protein